MKAFFRMSKMYLRNKIEWEINWSLYKLFDEDPDIGSEDSLYKKFNAIPGVQYEAFLTFLKDQTIWPVMATHPSRLLQVLGKKLLASGSLMNEDTGTAIHGILWAHDEWARTRYTLFGALSVMGGMARDFNYEDLRLLVRAWIQQVL